MNRIPSTRNRHKRRGLAPMELVLWLPILLFVMALMINFGTSAAWRVRGEIMARDVVWIERHHEDENRGQFPAAVTWPDTGGSASRTDDDPLEVLSDRSIYDDTDIVVRGPTLNDGKVTVKELFEPDIEGAYLGRARIERPYPFLGRLGSYDSGTIEHPMLERMWQSSEYGYGKYSFLPDRSYYEFGRAQRIGFPNRLRRISVLYEWDSPDLEAPFDQAWQAARQYENANRALDVLDGRDQWTAYFRKYRSFGGSFYPRPNMRVVETDREIVRKTAVERYLIDYLDASGEVRLGAICLIPRRLANSFSGYFSSVRAEINRRLDILRKLPPTGATAAQIAALEADLELVEQRLDEVKAFQAMIPGIEKALKKSSPAAAM